MKQHPEWLEKLKEWHKEGKVVAYVDEVGTGSLAGDVYTCAVILNEPVVFNKTIRDSKKLRKGIIYELSEVIKSEVNSYGIGIVEIDKVNSIGNMNTIRLLAFKKAVYALPVKPDIVLIDGNFEIKNLDKSIKQYSIIKGDDKVFGIACASIVAKQSRDHYMHDLHEEHPEYGWDKNVGYWSPLHLRALKDYGVTKYHRTFFKDVKRAMKYEKEN